MRAVKDKATDGRTARRLDTQTAVLDAARELFAEKGVSATSMDDIAERAGIAKGSLYYNFDSKSGLVSALFRRSLDRLQSVLAQAVDGLRGPELRRAVITAILAEMQTHPYEAKLLVTEVFRTDRDWRDSVQAWREALMRDIAFDLMGADPQLSERDASLQAAALIGATLMTGMEWLLYRPDTLLRDVVDATLTAVALA